MADNEFFHVPGRENRPQQHLPVAILIDKSESTEDIHDLMQVCTRELLKKLKSEPTFQKIVELLVVFFDKTYRETEFTPIDEIDPDELTIPKSSDTTHTGKALLYALDKLNEKKTDWKQKGEDYYQPLMFLLTDGYPDPGKGAPGTYVREVAETYVNAAKEVKRLEGNNKLVFIAAGVEREHGVGADMDKLRELTIHPDHIFTVSDSNGMDGVQRFFNGIYTMTAKMYRITPIGQAPDKLNYWDTEE